MHRLRMLKFNGKNKVTIQIGIDHRVEVRFANPYFRNADLVKALTSALSCAKGIHGEINLKALKRRPIQTNHDVLKDIEWRKQQMKLHPELYKKMLE